MPGRVCKTKIVPIVVIGSKGFVVFTHVVLLSVEPFIECEWRVVVSECQIDGVPFCQRPVIGLLQIVYKLVKVTHRPLSRIVRLKLSCAWPSCPYELGLMNTSCMNAQTMKISHRADTIIPALTRINSIIVRLWHFTYPAVRIFAHVYREHGNRIGGLTQAKPLCGLDGAGCVYGRHPCVHMF